MVANMIALKLGSSYTSIYKMGEGIVLFEPTMVAYTGVGKSRNIKAVGNKAKKILGRTTGQTYVNSPIFEGRVADTDLCVSMLKTFLAKIFPKRIIKPRIKAVVCVPMGLTLSEKKAYEKVCFLSGIQDVVLVPSILCAGLGYNLPITEPSGMMLVNIGGGSTDIAVTSLGGIVDGINLGIGGEMMDTAVEKYILDKYNLIIGKPTAEKIKIEVGSLYCNDMSNTEVMGLDKESKLSRVEVVESKDVYDAIQCYYNKIAEAIQIVLNNCPPNLVEDVTNEGIYMLGGASLITGADQYFRKKLNVNVIVEDPTSAIDVIGAGKLLSDPRLYNEFKDLI